MPCTSGDPASGAGQGDVVEMFRKKGGQGMVGRGRSKLPIPAGVGVTGRYRRNYRHLIFEV